MYSVNFEVLVVWQTTF